MIACKTGKETCSPPTFHQASQSKGNTYRLPGQLQALISSYLSQMCFIVSLNDSVFYNLIFDHLTFRSLSVSEFK